MVTRLGLLSLLEWSFLLSSGLVGVGPCGHFGTQIRTQWSCEFFVQCEFCFDTTLETCSMPPFMATYQTKIKFEPKKKKIPIQKPKVRPKPRIQNQSPLILIFPLKKKKRKHHQLLPRYPHRDRAQHQA